MYRVVVIFELILISVGAFHTNCIMRIIDYCRFQHCTCYVLPRCMECRRGLAMRILSVRHTRAL